MTTHRASIPLPCNDSAIEQPDGLIYHTGIERPVMARFLSVDVAEEIQYHRTHGFSPNCTRCLDEARKPVDVETMRRQLEKLETAWTDALTKEQADAIFPQMADLQAAIEKLNGAMDDYAEARREARFGCAL